ncbi:MAG: LuxR C-terminal-related transcriptional regulator, partial [Gaiellaceae bacterium]
RMPYLAGVRLVRALRDASPATRIAVYTADGDELLAESVLEAGASGVILKEAPLADLLRALEAVLSGRTYVDPTLLREASPRTQLTQRELDVLGLLAEGLPHAEIGDRLGISSETVRTHLRKASNRLGAATRTQAVATALRRGLIA